MGSSAQPEHSVHVLSASEPPPMSGRDTRERSGVQPDAAPQLPGAVAPQAWAGSRDGGDIGTGRLIVTAASAAYGPSLLALLGSLNCNWPSHPPVKVYDIGLDGATRRRLATFGITPEEVPPFCPHWRRHFTWKIWCLNHAPARDILWMDAGVAVLRPLEEAFLSIDRLGYFLISTYRQLGEQAPSPAVSSSGLHPDFGKDRLTLAAGLMGLRKQGAGLKVLRDALRLALDEKNLAATEPEHRHDQALLSLLLYREYGHVLTADQRIYLNSASPAGEGQKVWVHRRTIRAADAAFLARQTSPRDSAAYLPGVPNALPWPERLLRMARRIWRRLQRTDREIGIYDGNREPASRDQCQGSSFAASELTSGPVGAPGDTVARSTGPMRTHGGRLEQ